MAKGIIDTCCGYGKDGAKSNYDCVQIPSASKAADKAILPGVAGFCGINGLVTVAGTAPATVCCKIKFNYVSYIILCGLNVSFLAHDVNYIWVKHFFYSSCSYANTIWTSLHYGQLWSHCRCCNGSNWNNERLRTQLCHVMLKTNLIKIFFSNIT